MSETTDEPTTNETDRPPHAIGVADAISRVDVDHADLDEQADLEHAPAAQLQAEPPPVPDLPLAMMVESLLLVADEPVTDMLLAELVGHPAPDVLAQLERLAQDYLAQGRGYELRQVAGGWRLYTRAECSSLVERFVLRGQTARMTQAALETLAVVAYRQPVTRGRVAAVRGVNVDGVIRTLLSRGLISERGSDPESSATLYGTTELFLERLGLRDLEELPALAPLLPDLESLEYGQDSIST